MSTGNSFQTELPTILGIGNLTSRTIKGQATARNVRGVREAET